jgi:hypothetical protein
MLHKRSSEIGPVDDTSFAFGIVNDVGLVKKAVKRQVYAD